MNGDRAAAGRGVPPPRARVSPPLVAVLTLLLAQPGCTDGPGDAGELPATATARVTDVVDGDTIEVSLEGRHEDVRYIGVDTPETVDPERPVECYGRRASSFNRSLVEDEQVELTFDRELRDDYGRLLAYVRRGPTFVNAALVRGGYARTLAIAPNTARRRQLARLQQRAAIAGRGLWGRC